MTSTTSGKKQLLEFEKYRQKGEIGRSFSHLSLALLLSPHLKQHYYSTYLRIFEKWISKVEASQTLTQVMTLYEVALNHYPQSPDLNHLLASTLYRHGSVHEAWNHACVAQTKCPRDPCTSDIQGRLANCLVDRWHLPMLNDEGRNTAYKRAITGAVKKGYNTVLDIGSGTGLLSIYAFWAGAEEVFACEVDRFMCEMCESVLQMNHNTAAIQILNKHSKDINIPTDIPQRFSLVVSETMDAGLFGEHILSTLQHAWQHLLLPPHSAPQHETTTRTVQSHIPHDKTHTTSSQTSDTHTHGHSRNDIDKEEENSATLVTEVENMNVTEEKTESQEYGRVIPARAEVFVALISCSYVAKQTKYLFSDIECLKDKQVHVRLEEPYLSEKLSCIPGGFKLLSEWTQITTVDFNSLEDITKHLTGEVNKMIPIKCTQEGSLDAIVLAFNLHLDEDNCIRTFPESQMQTVWENAVYPVVNSHTVASQDTITLDFECHGVIKLAIQDPIPSSSYSSSVNLKADALRFLNSRSFVDGFLAAARQASRKIQQSRGKNNGTNPCPVNICDALPFPVAGLCLQSLLPFSKLYVEDEDVKEVLQELGVQAGLCEELQRESLDVLFLWPMTQEGTLTDGIAEKIKMYRMLLASDGLVFPQEVEVVVDVVSSPTLEACCQVNDENTCGVTVAKVFNMLQTTHQLDVTLSSAPHTASAISRPIPMLKLSLVSGQAESLVKSQKPSETQHQDASEGLLVLGGEVVEASTHQSISRSTTLSGLPYWFHIKGDMDDEMSTPSTATRSESDAVLSTFGWDSPCNQSVFMLREPLKVEAGEVIAMQVLWREGVFSATLERISD